MTENIILKTALEFSKRLSNKYNCNIFLKREDKQIVRSFKIRGAYNKIINTRNKKNGFVTSSAGNHAQGVAYICNSMNLESTIFVPETTPLQKISRIKYFGGNKCTLYQIGKTFDDCLAESLLFSNKNNKTFIHPFNDRDVIKGQSTITKEILEDINPDIIFCGIGGGGLISGTILATQQYYMSKCDVIGVEPVGAASMYTSIKNNKITVIDNIDTFVDGASVKKVGDITFNYAKFAKDIVTVNNGIICKELIDIYQNEGIILEPAGALSIAGLSKIPIEYLSKKNVVCILSGGNNDLMRYPEIIEKSLHYQNLKYYFIIDFKQIPGELKKFVMQVLTKNSDITRFEYIKKNNKNSGSVLIALEVSNIEDIGQIKHNMNKFGFKFFELNENNILLNYNL